jgi:hypothetical protein
MLSRVNTLFFVCEVIEYLFRVFADLERYKSNCKLSLISNGRLVGVHTKSRKIFHENDEFCIIIQG